MVNRKGNRNQNQEILPRRSDSHQGEECTFQQKIQNAMKANFSAAIVFNYKDDVLIQMGELVNSRAKPIRTSHRRGQG